MCCWNFFGCGCRRRCRSGCWNYNNNYGVCGCRNYGRNDYNDGYNGRGHGHGNNNCRDGYDGHKDHHSGCKCKHQGRSNY